MFLEISQNLQENTCDRVSFLIKCNFIKKEALAEGFSCEFYQICKKAFFTQHLRVTASVLADMIICTPGKHYNAAEQQNEANNKCHRKSAKKKGRCQNIAKYLTQNKKN